MDENSKTAARAWFESLRDRIVADFEALEDEAPASLYPGAAGHFAKTPWKRALGEHGEDQGGGTMGMMRGRLFEKVGVHTSTVHGLLSPEFAKQVKGAVEQRMFWASGISLIAHMRNPRIPAVHMNTRLIVTSENWFGGGADLNPTLDASRTEAHPDAVTFHAAMKDACDAFDAGFHPKYKKWADEYFWLPHRGDPRGVFGQRGEVVDFVGIIREIEELRAIDLRVTDELEALIAEGALDFLISEGERGTGGFARIAQRGAEVDAFVGLGPGDLG